MIENTLPVSSAMGKTIRVHGGKFLDRDNHAGGGSHEGEHHAGETLPESVMIANALPESPAMENLIFNTILGSCTLHKIVPESCAMTTMAMARC